MISPGCLNCYVLQSASDDLTQETKNGPIWNGELRWNEAQIDVPAKSRHAAWDVCPHGDVFHENAPDDWLDRIFDVILRCPGKQFQILTKRSARAASYIADKLPHGLPDNVIIGVSAERQAEADARLPDLMRMRARHKFWTAFPLLGEIDVFAIPVSVAELKSLRAVNLGEDPLRPARPEWIARLIDDLRTLDIPVSIHDLADAVKRRGY